MTDNIQKLYEIAGVEKKPVYSGSQLYNPVITGYEYPPFTAEKQLELIKKILEKGLLQISRSSWGNIQFCNFGNAGDYKAEFDEALASFIINLWQDLTDNQKQEIKRILQ